MQGDFYDFLSTRHKESLALVCKDDKEAELLADVALLCGYQTFVFPDIRLTYGDDLRPWSSELQNLFVQWGAIGRAKEAYVVITPVTTALLMLPDFSYFSTHTLEFGERILLEELKNLLVRWGYEVVDMVEQAGEVSFRGDIIDIFPVNTVLPVRISLFDAEIESIRHFDVSTQKSSREEQETLTFLPALFSLDEGQYTQWMSDIEKFDGDTFFKDGRSLGMWALPCTKNISQFLSLWGSENFVCAEFIHDERGVVEAEKFSLELLPFSTKFSPFSPKDLNEVIELNKESKKIVLIVRNESHLKQLGIDTSHVDVVYGEWVVNIASHDMIIMSAVEKRKTKKIPKASLMIDDLRTGEFVIHHLYGLGKFEGLRSVSILGGTRDFLSIKYAGEDKLLLPVENIDMIDRYIANSGAVPVVDKLGKGSFVKLKESVKKRLFEIAGEIVNMAAHRQMKKGLTINTTDPRIKIFQQNAGFGYTEDQIHSIKEIFDDLSSGMIMDRLLSGDVGFGKTEVALNAVYAAVCSGYQALVLVPTTLLSSQHTKTFIERLEPLGIKVGRLDRFSTPKEKKALLLMMEDGNVDVVVGTHTLLDVKMKNVGLVVIDEEHKFGVKQKEKLKILKADVHLLSMSATPIPRSLNMALSKIKGYSQITTPPLARVGVRTFVKEYNEPLLKEVILREIRRGGQLFYIHNRIASIEEKKRVLLGLIPQLRIAVLHSDIDAVATEKILLEFMQGNYDLLLSTSIVESGIHIPKVNTILVDGANRFGLGDLHQLRGRVGRGSIEGYCYYLVDDRENLTQEAMKRLAALESNSHLGSGAVLAFHDLEIRGGGNLVGDAQSGHIKNIGYSLYLRLLEDAIASVSGEMAHEEKSVEIKLAVSAMLSSDVISEDRLRLELYRRFGQCKTLAEVYEIEEEMIDRFGALDALSKNYISLMVIKLLALSQEIKLLSSYGVTVTLSYENGKNVTLTSPSKDDDDIIYTTLSYLQEKRKP